MEIHRPKPIHGWRQFLAEIAVIVIGVLIALSAEQIVQRFEWREKIRLADVAMRNEIAKDDGPNILERIALSDCIDASLRRIRSGVESGARRAEVLRAIDQFAVPHHTWDSQDFDAAKDEGAILRMTHGSGWWKLVYSTMPSLDRGGEREFDDGAALGAISRAGGSLTEAEKARILLAVETLSRDNRRMTADARFVQSGIDHLHIALAPRAVQRGRDELAKTPGAGACIAKFEEMVSGTPLANN